jgi:hypothetical protein
MNRLRGSIEGKTMLLFVNTDNKQKKYKGQRTKT